MGKNQILTKEQKIILDEVSKNDFLLKNFYFTGGTALSAVYLKHRYSEDLDFFSDNGFDNQVIFTLFEDWGKKYKFTIDSRFVEVVYTFFLTFQNKKEVKVDFGYYPCKRLERGNRLGNLDVDSLDDIAVNKLLTISQRSNVKDFVDLYFLFKKFTIWDLIDGLKVKFGRKVELFILAADFMKVDSFEDMPNMIKPLTLPKLKEFFREQAKKLGKSFTE